MTFSTNFHNYRSLLLTFFIKKSITDLLAARIVFVNWNKESGQQSISYNWLIFTWLI